jgi:hypothetical protein
MSTESVSQKEKKNCNEGPTILSMFTVMKLAKNVSCFSKPRISERMKISVQKRTSRTCPIIIQQTGTTFSDLTKIGGLSRK